MAQEKLRTAKDLPEDARKMVEGAGPSLPRFVHRTGEVREVAYAETPSFAALRDLARKRRIPRETKEVVRGTKSHAALRDQARKRRAPR
jgi:hypothetical protein